MRPSPRVAWTAIAVVSLMALAAAAFAAIPRSSPSVRTDDLYTELLASRQSPDVGYQEPPAPSVRDLMVEPPPPPAAAPAAVVERLAIPSLKVDVPVLVGNLSAERKMVDPPDATTVVWYDFTSSPGQGGNAVFSGHLDYAGYGPAIFWNLKNLTRGDAIQVALRDGTTVEYSVTGLQLYPVETIPMREVLAPTTTESITLITCGGTFANGEYSHRLIVRAARVR